MAAPTRYASPAEQMSALARGARLRGLTFDEFWEEAFRPGKALIATSTPAQQVPAFCVLWPSDSVEARLWREATKHAMHGWERAYYNLPATAAETALTRLGPALKALAA